MDGEHDSPSSIHEGRRHFIGARSNVRGVRTERRIRGRRIGNVRADARAPVARAPIAGATPSRALALSSLNAAQRSQIEALVAEEQASHAMVHAARAKVLTTLAGQVDQGAVSRAALAPALQSETDALVASRLRERSIEERLHTILTAKECEEVGGGKDFLRPAAPESKVRAHVEHHAERMVEHLEKRVPTLSAEQRASLAAKLRERAAH